MKKIVFSLIALGIFISGLTYAAGGFNQYGYNYTARNFVGTGSSWCQGKFGWDKAKCDTYMGSYANDHLVMKWNKAWDDCNVANANGTNNASTCSGATLTNEWNGMVPGGSGETEHFKAVWSQTCYNNETLTDGGYCIWGQYEAIMDFYGPGKPIWYSHAIPAGFGSH